MPAAKLTVLNSMASRDFEQALEQHIAWDLEVLDLKDRIFGKSIADLDDRETARADEIIRSRDLKTYCFSTSLFHAPVERGEGEFRDRHLAGLDRVLAIAQILQPRFIRLIAAEIGAREDVPDAIAHVEKEHPWLIPLYREAVDRIRDAGFRAAIENEGGGCIFSTPREVLDFFQALDREGAACFTWDVQNLWRMGVFPSIEVYEQLKPVIGYYHLKGGEKGEAGNRLVWASGLEEASWPVVEITRQVVADGRSPVICLNPSHGKLKEGRDYTNVTQHDIEFIRRAVPGIEGGITF